MSIAFFNIVLQSFKNLMVNPVSLLPARILDTPSQIRFNLKAALHSIRILPDFVHFSLFSIFVQKLIIDTVLDSFFCFSNVRFCPQSMHQKCFLCFCVIKRI